MSRNKKITATTTMPAEKILFIITKAFANNGSVQLLIVKFNIVFLNAIDVFHLIDGT